ncbi:phytanoyl-CoA dioxygenase family protein [Streptomyces sp. NPDC002187]|uniref:phytanoyl-CoA dioxygenase family protein n=1 Tax=Streptomyces sp. NPDC002187 TaxID=3364637 RepID=UPI0036881CED
MSLVVDHLSRSIDPLRVNAKGDACRLDHVLERDPVFLEALRSPAVSAPLEGILGPTVDVVRHRHNHATRNAPGDIPFRLHRDIQQWSQPLVAVFIYLQDSEIGNGCTTIVPGTHRVPYAGPQSAGGGGNWADEHPEYQSFVGQELPIEMPRGGVLFLNCLCFHSVGRQPEGSASKTRYSVVFACRSADELASIESPDVVRLFGERRYLANDHLPVSGSLLQGSRATGGRHG